MASPTVTKTVEALNGIPFGTLLAGPLTACVDAQNQAAYSTLNFINSFGLVDDGDDKKAVYVNFSYQTSDGQTMQIKVPLLSIVPIPYIAIETIDINFTCSVSGLENSKIEGSSDISTDTSVDANTKGKRIFKQTTSQLKTSVSSKRSSVNTRDSQFSIEATMDISVHARQDSMPAGMAKVLEIFNSTIELSQKNTETKENS